MGMLLGTTMDVSILTRFFFWEKVYYRANENAFPSASKEELGHMVGFAENVGHSMTYLVLTESNKVVPRSELRSAESTSDKNAKTELLGGESAPP